MRDSQKAKWYRAIESCQVGSEQLGTIEKCQAFINRCLRLKRFQTAFPQMVGKKVRVKEAKTYADCRYGYVELPPWARSKAQVLMMLATYINKSLPGFVWDTWHGREVCRTFVEVVGVCLGREDEKKLRAAFREHKVKHTKKRQLNQALKDHNDAIKQLIEAPEIIQQESDK